MNQLPEIKAFVYEDAPNFKNLKINYVHGHDPIISFLDEKGTKEKVDLEKYNRAQCIKLLDAHGIVRKKESFDHLQSPWNLEHSNADIVRAFKKNFDNLKDLEKDPTCYTSRLFEGHSYDICLFSRVMQRQYTKSKVVGVFEKAYFCSDDENDTSVCLKYAGGDYCGDVGYDRTATVRLVCEEQGEGIKVDERRQCQYDMTLWIPEACDLDFREPMPGEEEYTEDDDAATTGHEEL